MIPEGSKQSAEQPVARQQAQFRRVSAPGCIFPGGGCVGRAAALVELRPYAGKALAELYSLAAVLSFLS